MIDTVVCVLFKGTTVQKHSRDLYDPEWVNKLYRGFKRHLSSPFEFVCITDYYWREFESGVQPVIFQMPNRDYFSILEAFRPGLNLGRALLTGLDTIITGSMDEICSYQGSYALISNKPREKCVNEAWYNFWPRIQMANAVCIYDEDAATELWQKFRSEPLEHWHQATRMPDHTEGSEMVFMYEQMDQIDDLSELYPGQIASFPRQVEPRGYLVNERLVYFHGKSKPSLHRQHPIVKEHWI